MLREILEEMNEGTTLPLSDRSNASTFNSKKKKMSDVDSSVGDKDSSIEMFTQDKTVYQRIGKKYYSQSFSTEEDTWSYLNKIA